MLERNADAWKDKKIRIIGLSIDKTADKVVKHVDEKKWTSVEHYHRAGSKCSDTYSVSGVPHVMLIDQNGKIVFKGHPAGRPDLEKDLNDLADGKELSKKEEEKKDAVDAPEKPLDVTSMHMEIDTFKTDVAPQLQKDLKSDLEGFQRAFCVMIGVQEINPETREEDLTYKNIRLLVGPKEPLEKAKAHLEEKVKG